MKCMRTMHNTIWNKHRMFWHGRTVSTNRYFSYWSYFDVLSSELTKFINEILIASREYVSKCFMISVLKQYQKVLLPGIR